MKLWYTLVPVAFLIIGLVWLSQAGRREQAETVLGVVDVREASPWAMPPQALAEHQKELAQRKDQLAKIVEQPTHRPQPKKPAIARQPQPQARTTNTLEQVNEDAAQTSSQMDVQERERQERQRIEQIVSHLDDALHSEPDDGGWATQMEVGLAENFDADDWHGNTLAEANCRATLCRIVVAHEDLGAADAFVARMGTLQSFANTEGFYQKVTLTDGTSATVVYIARQGYRLPSMPSP